MIGLKAESLKLSLNNQHHNNLITTTMIEPFDIEIGELTYAVFPEEDEIYTIFKDGIEYVKIQKDTEAFG